MKNWKSVFRVWNTTPVILEGLKVHRNAACVCATSPLTHSIGCLKNSWPMDEQAIIKKYTFANKIVQVVHKDWDENGAFRVFGVYMTKQMHCGEVDDDAAAEEWVSFYGWSWKQAIAGIHCKEAGFKLTIAVFCLEQRSSNSLNQMPPKQLSTTSPTRFQL